ncbi:hypothetical protein ATANTOWER_031141 [Ataeniobius toweri]|uniref:Uncharacterized protein n=1 Tax=Ataeniobius toweri TaxID=208326 RepID=A0ABU7A1B8_9TELE|nr:hypothetical protein [Ataeniobius toweri]
MGSVSESSRSIVVCVSVFMCTDEGGNVLCRASAWGVMCPEVSGPWVHVDLLWQRRLLERPVGSSLQLPGASALWLLGDSPGTLPCSSLLGESRRWLSWGSCALGGFWMFMAQIFSVPVPGPGGQVCGSSHSLLYIFIDKPCIHKCAYTQIPRCLDSGVNRYTNVLY